MAEFSLKSIIMFFVVILIGVVFLGQIEDNVAATEVIESLTNNETITYPGNNTVYTLANDDIVSGSEIVYNVTTKLVRNTHYTITRSTITFTNISDPGDIYDVSIDFNITYDHEGDLYVSNTTSRNLLKLIGIFFVLVIIAFAIKAIRDSSDDFNFGFKKE